jgi:Tol biopolymer transport system component
MRNRKIGAYAMVAAIVAIAVVAIAVVRNGPTTPVPADDPTPTEGLGIFAPVAGRIVFASHDGHASIWAADPSAPSPSTLVRLDLGEDAFPPDGSGDDVEPLGWSSDGTELLVARWEGFDATLYVVHADGTQTLVPGQNPDAGVESGAISPDGSRVVFADQGLTVADIERGGTAKLPYPAGGEPSGLLTFSPDGTQIAYAAFDEKMWVVNADGTDAHEILAHGPALAKGVGNITWSPAGDRIAIELGGAIYTFAPNGSDFTKVITSGFNPYWSPDGSKIAYVSGDVHGRGLAIADADGSNVREFGFAFSGPWYPGA